MNVFKIGQHDTEGLENFAVIVVSFISAPSK